MTAAAKRNIRPRPVLVVRPSYVSQESAFAILGITPRKFLELVVPNCNRVTRLGKTALVEMDEAERVIRGLAASAGDDDGDAAADDDDDPGQPRTAEEVLERLGYARTG